ncbi:MAG: transposase [Rickettsia endosymbiont of Labidopullus appendiculatus]|nr:transposase [Rickettsia endosymbiont of Labidopullus appendiculatus]
MSKIIGLDVSKQWLDICVYNTSDKPKYHRFANDAAGHEEVIKLAKEQEIKLIICEPTGGYKAEICQKLDNNNQQIHKINTYSFNSFSKSVNLCKTDRKDAFKLAYYADKMQLSANYIYQVESEEHEEQLKQETIQRWQEMKEGKFLGNDKITEWLDRWGSDKEEERP